MFLPDRPSGHNGARLGNPKSVEPRCNALNLTQSQPRAKNRNLAAYLIAALAFLTPLPPANSAQHPDGDLLFETFGTFEPSEAMSQKQMADLLQEAMPLPVSRFSRKLSNGRYLYGVSLDASSIPEIKDGIVSFTFKLNDDASEKAFKSTVAKVARKIRIFIMKKSKKITTPG